VKLFALNATHIHTRQRLTALLLLRDTVLQGLRAGAI
jgi:hypothetical protein